MSVYSVYFNIFYLLWKSLKKKPMENITFTSLVKSHLNTSNVYVRRAIVAENIANITNFLKSTPKAGVSTNLYFEIVKLRKKQESILKDLDIIISQTEQQAFQFGGL